MALQDMLQTIEDEGTLRCNEIKERAEAEAERTLRSADEEAENIRKEAYQRYAEKAPAEANRIVSKEKLNSRLKVIQSREALVTQAFEQAKSELEEIRKTDKYSKILSALLDEAMSEAACPCTIFVSPDDVNATKEWAQKRGSQIDVTGDENIVGGCNVEAGDGSIYLVNDLMSRFDVVMDSMKANIVHILFAEGQ